MASSSLQISRSSRALLGTKDDLLSAVGSAMEVLEQNAEAANFTVAWATAGITTSKEYFETRSIDQTNNERQDWIEVTVTATAVKIDE